MELVDGTKEQRPNPEIIMGALENAGREDEEALQKVESADGLPNNLLKFLARMQKRGITAVTLTTIDPNVFRAFIKAIPYLEQNGTEAGIAQHKTKNKFIGRVVFGKDKLEVEL